MMANKVFSIVRDESVMDEIRPGRKLMRRRVTFGSEQEEDDSTHQHDNDNDHEFGGTVGTIVSLLFVHGSCASSDQFDDLLNSTRNIMNHPSRKNNEGEKKARRINTVECHLFDAFGCGQSRIPDSKIRWEDFSERELARDLRSMYESVVSEVPKESSLYVVAHSYGTSQVIKLIAELEEEGRKLDEPESDGGVAGSIEGAILIGGALHGSPHEAVANVTKGGGHWIFRLPVFALNWLQPSLSEAFISGAYHPSSLVKREDIIERARGKSNTNSMRMCQAFYRQKEWATAEDAKRVQTKTLVIHGEDDSIVPLEGGKYLSESLPASQGVVIVAEASHQVFEEHPDLVGDRIWQFIVNAPRASE